MTADPVQVYLESSRSLASATQVLSKIIRTITDAAEKLRNPLSVAVTGAACGIPPHLHGTQNTIQADEWPSAESIAQALLGLQNAHDSCHIAWGLVPVSRRSGLQPPPGESS